MGMMQLRPSQGSDSEAINVWITPDLYQVVFQSAPMQEDKVIKRDRVKHRDKDKHEVGDPIWHLAPCLSDEKPGKLTQQ